MQIASSILHVCDNCNYTFVEISDQSKTTWFCLSLEEKMNVLAGKRA